MFSPHFSHMGYIVPDTKRHGTMTTPAKTQQIKLKSLPAFSKIAERAMPASFIVWLSISPMISPNVSIAGRKMIAENKAEFKILTPFSS
jgi:hypothetical protein